MCLLNKLINNKQRFGDECVLFPQEDCVDDTDEWTKLVIETTTLCVKKGTCPVKDIRGR